jgi:GNAT superfamily N-acetyltransferase
MQAADPDCPFWGDSPAAGLPDIVRHELSAYRPAHRRITFRQGIQPIMTDRRFEVRAIRRADYDGWRPLWDGYNAFYGRSGATALPEEITQTTWERFFDPAEPVHALVAEREGRVVGLAHYLYHRSTTRLREVCYLQDLFTAAELRGLGIGRHLIHGVYDAARAAGCSRVYWQTQVTNQPGRALYDKVAQHNGFIVYSHELT